MEFCSWKETEREKIRGQDYHALGLTITTREVGSALGLWSDCVFPLKLTRRGTKANYKAMQLGISNINKGWISK